MMLQFLKTNIIFSGKINRRRFLLGILVNVLVLMFSAFAGAVMIKTLLRWEIVALLLYGGLLVYFVLSMASLILRRLYDINLKSWIMLLIFVPIFGWVALMVLTMTGGKNQEDKHEPKWKFFLSVFWVIIGWFGMMCLLLVVLAMDVMSEKDAIDSNPPQKMGIITREAPFVHKTYMRQVDISNKKKVDKPIEVDELYCGVTQNKIIFNDGEYFLNYLEEQHPEHFVMEYIHKGEIVERFYNTVMIQCNSLDMENVIESAVNYYRDNFRKGQEPVSVIEQDEDHAIIEIIRYDKNKKYLFEWNLIKLEKMGNNKKDLMSTSFVKRMYMDDGENVEDKFKEAVIKWREQYLNKEIEKIK